MDLRTIVIWSGLVFLGSSLLLWVFYASFKPRQLALRLWAAGYSSVSIGSIFLMLRGYIPEALSVLLANLLMLEFFPFLIEGYRVLGGERPRMRLATATAVLVLAFQGFFTLVANLTSVRAAFFSAATAAMALAFARELLRRENGVPPLQRRIAAGFAIAQAFVYLARLVAIAFQGLPRDLMMASSLESLFQGFAAAIFGTMLLPLAFMFAGRLNAELVASVEKHEILLREMTHRIKNDLALVSSLISLKQDTIADPVLAASLDDLRERILCIGAAHDQFSRQGGDVGLVRVDEYFEVIAEALPASPRVSVLREFEAAELPFKVALSLGLVLHELAVNAIKYAFPGDGRGELRLAFRVEGDRGLLVVADDGVGFAWPPRNPGLGSTIVEAMASSLKAEIRFEASGGSRFEVSAPLRGTPPARDRPGP